MKRLLELRWPLLDQAMVSATNFLVGVVLMRMFGVEEYGIYVLLWAVVQFTQSFQSALLIAPMQTIAPTLAAGQSAYFVATVRWFVLFAAASGALVLAIATAAGHWLPPFWRSGYAPALALWVVAMQLQDGMRRLQIARGRERNAFVADVVAYPGQIAIMWWAGSQGLGLAPTILCFSAMLAVSALVAGLPAAFFPGTPAMPLAETWKRNWPSSRWLAATALLQWLSGNYVLMSAAVILGPAVTGAIRAAQNLLAVTHVLFQGLENIVPVRAARAFAQGGWHAMTAYTKKVGIGLLLATGGVALVAFLFARQILEIAYGAVPDESMTATIWYVPIYLVMAAVLPTRTILKVIAQTRPIFFGYSLSAIASMGLSYIAPAYFGVHGVMAAILTSCILIILPQHLAIQRFNRDEDRSHSKR